MIRSRLAHLCVIIIACFLTLPKRAAAEPSSQQLYLECLADFQRYSETIWTNAPYSNAPADSGYWGDGKSLGNGGIRGSCGVAVSLAVLVRAYPDSVERGARLSKIRQALNYAANTHVSGTNVCVDNLQWGHGWQSALWAGSMGLACQLVEGDLPPATVRAVQSALADEADYRAGIPPASGYIGDTKAEENGWNGNVVALAAAWLKTNAGAGEWLNSAKSYLANTYTVADTVGDPLADWITTTTLYPDFSLENHGFYHPTYQMVSGMSMGDSLLMARLSDSAVATELQEFAEHNVLKVWTNLSYLLLDSSEFAYPSGLDWELHDFEQNSYIAWLASHFDIPLARWADGQLAKLTRYRQIVNGDGRFVGPSGGGFYREAVEARRTAIAWLHWSMADHAEDPAVVPDAAFKHFSTVKIIASRGPAGFVSLSYGAKIMACIEPPTAPGGVPTNAYVTTPMLPGIIGLGLLGNPTAARLVSCLTNATGFEAQLELTHGQNGTTDVYVNSTGESVGIVEVPRPLVSLSGSAASFSVGIENDPLTGGSRTAEWTGGFAVISNRTGTVRSMTNNWICIAGRYGVAAGPQGYFKYQAASSYNRSGAAQDSLQFFPQDPVGPRYAVWFPGQSASQTSSKAAQISWATSAEAGMLTFPGAGGDTAHISFQLPSVAVYPPAPLSVSSVSASSAQTAYSPTNAVDRSVSTFWVSLNGPTNHAEWLKATFPRPVAISSFQVYPRTENGGYGPSDIQLFLNVTNGIPASGIPASGTVVQSARMAPTSMYEGKLSAPAVATNAVLVITGAYDRGITNNPRNVQVMELIFYERAAPGTYGDWMVRNFTDSQLRDSEYSCPACDSDKDGVPNLVEFSMGGNPVLADAALTALQTVPATPGAFAFNFRERANLDGTSRRFEGSTNLLEWTEVTPEVLLTITNNTDINVRKAVFNMQPAGSFFRLKFARP